MGHKVFAKVEIGVLDIVEMGMLAYADFAQNSEI